MKKQFAGILTSLLLFATGAATVQDVSGAPISFDNEAGDSLWINKTNWTGNELPGPGDDAIIGGAYNVTLASSGEQTIRSLQCEGSLTITRGARVAFSAASQINGTLTLGSFDPPHLGTLHGAVDTAPTMNIAGAFNWFGGTLSGGGVFNARAGISISGNVGKELRGATLNNPATVTWTGMGNIAIGGRFNNAGTFSVSNDASIILLGAPQGFFNTGTFNKTGGAGTTSISVPFHNSGAVRVTRGTLELRADGGHAGTFETFLGCRLRFVSGLHIADGVTFSSSGVVSLDGAVIDLTNTVRAVNFELNGRELTGRGTLEVSESFRWISGTMSGAGKTDVNGTLEISGNIGKFLNRRTLNSRRSATWTGANIGVLGGGVFNNAAGATFLDNSSNSNPGLRLFGVTGAEEGTFNNDGTYDKTGTELGRTRFNIAFNNNGTVNVGREKYFELAAGGAATSGAIFNPGTAAEIIFVRGTYIVDAAILGVPQSSFGHCVVRGATVEIRRVVTAADISFDAGVITGAGTLDASQMSWRGGSMTGSGVTSLRRVLVMSTPVEKRVVQRTLRSAGNGFWETDGGNVTVSSGGSIHNLPGGTFYVYNNRTVDGDGKFVNGGRFIRVSGSRSNVFNVQFDNEATGSVEINTGRLILGGGGTSSGTFTAQSGTDVTIARGEYFLDGGSLGGEGFYRVDGANAVARITANNMTASNFELANGGVSGAGELSVTGTLNWRGGEMSGTGVTIANGKLAIFGDSSKKLTRRTFINAGEATWEGAGGIDLSLGAFITNRTGATFTVNGSVDSGGDGSFINQGTFTKLAGTGLSIIGNNFTNTGSVFVQTGTRLRFFKGYNQTGGVLNVDGAIIDGDITAPDGNIDGDGNVNGALSAGGAVRPGTSPGMIQVTGNYTQSASGVFDVEIAGRSADQFDQLQVSGTATLAGTLNVKLLDGFQPAVGDRFTILTHGSRSGRFGVTNGLMLSAGGRFEVEYGPNGVTLITRDTHGFAVLLEAGAGQLSLRFPTIQGRRYRIEFTDDVLSRAWQPAAEIAGDGTEKSYAITMLPGRRHGYYRVVQML